MRSPTSRGGAATPPCAVRRVLLLVLVVVLAACQSGEGPSETSGAPDAPTGDAAQTEATGNDTDDAADEGGADEAGSSEAEDRGARVEPVPDEEGSEPVPADPGPLPETRVALVGPDGERIELVVELASDPDARQRGLMLRPEVRDGAGMLFLFPGDNDGGFWMRNTLVPLDIAYVDADGVVVDVRTMTPCEADPCPSYRPDGSYRYALEVAAGVLREAGVDDAWSLELPDALPEAS